jgi:hypothetical protein
MASARRGTPGEEWWMGDEIGAVVGAQGILWYGYPVSENRRLGPFRSRLEAERALAQTYLKPRPTRRRPGL